MSTTRSSSDGTIKTFATLQIVGDRLDPAEITQILRITPTLAYSKGQSYHAGQRSQNMVGRTGVWYLATDKVIQSTKLHDHLMPLFFVLALDQFEEWGKERARPQGRIKTTYHFRLMGRLAKLAGIIKRESLRATLTCFWHGAAGAKHPSIPRVMSAVLKDVPISIETDFDTDERSDSDPIRLRA
jgi:hypothetical protein